MEDRDGRGGEERAPWADGSEGGTEIGRDGLSPEQHAAIAQSMEDFERLREDAADLIRLLAAIGADTVDEAIGRVNRWKRDDALRAAGNPPMAMVSGLAALVGRAFHQHGVEMTVTIKPRERS